MIMIMGTKGKIFGIDNSKKDNDNKNRNKNDNNHYVNTIKGRIKCTNMPKTFSLYMSPPVV